MPALRDRAWIVVPFTNVTRAPELEWLRDASVNLLSLDLSRWTDLIVVDDKRVADLMRETPGRGALSLSDGLALAKRAGAGHLVMGDYVKAGKSLRIVASVIDVRSGERVRSVLQQTSDGDSLLAAFAPLARGVLAVPPPPDARVGATGTTRVDAYQEYLAGVNALNSFDLDVARRHLRAALALDSSFALAHYKLSVVLHWAAVAGDTSEVFHAQAAARLGGGLPPRERALITARVASASGDYVRACGTLRTLAARDSADAEALYAVGECEYHAGLIEPEVMDSVNGRFRGNWNAALAAFRRVLQVDPAYHPAFGHVLDILTSDIVTICPSAAVACANDVRTFNAFVVRDGDTLIVQPVRGDFKVKRPWMIRRTTTQTPLKNAQAAQRVARDWVDAGPAEPRAHLALAQLDLRLADPAAALRELSFIPAVADSAVRHDTWVARAQAAIVLGQTTVVRAALDTLRRLGGPSALTDDALAQLAGALGKLEPLRALIRTTARNERWSPERLAYWSAVPRVLLGLPDASLADVERRYFEATPGDTACQAGRPRCKVTMLLETQAYAPRMPRSASFYSRDPVGVRFYVAYAVAARDTAWLRRLPRYMDSLSVAAERAGITDLGFIIFETEAHLALGDTAAALAAARRYTEVSMPALAYVSVDGQDFADWQYLTLPRMILLRADLAMASGARDEARTWYARLLDMWKDADPELQPTVTRVKAALATIGSR